MSKEIYNDVYSMDLNIQVNISEEDIHLIYQALISEHANYCGSHEQNKNVLKMINKYENLMERVRDW